MIADRLPVRAPSGFQGDPVLAVEALCLTMRNAAILTDVDLAVTAGETVAVVGRNGAGKSSLLRCLARVQHPTGGRVRLAGQDIWQMSGSAFARRVATVPQETPADFGLTVAEMVALGRLPHRRSVFGLEDADRTAIDIALRRVDMGHLADRDVATLSGGERQRVMIARALAQQPEVLILDEPTNHLDIRHRLELVALITALPITVVTTVHDLEMAAEIADRVVVLDAGRAIADGPPDRTLTAAVIGEAFGVDVRVDRAAPSDPARFQFSIPV